MSPDPLLLESARVIGIFLTLALVLVLITRRALSTLKPGLAREIWLRYLAWVGFVLALLALLVLLAVGRSTWILAVVVPLLGDRFEGMLKTVVKGDLGFKDWGAAIPGHDGVLDRTKSFLFATRIFFDHTRYFFT